ncbi:jg5558 [Pararge aegeria aegeria]|uniref:Jg5558 protein n=1 Tax=Pararge aegeria aegeria TaxID=348720 RepID=A0A8S4RL90_9NEOP|nr:jg5558 [Pararge aegeria aegeria]
MQSKMNKKILSQLLPACPQQAPLGKAAALRQQTAGVSRHVLPKATRLVSRSLPLQLHAAPTLLLSPQIDRPTRNNLLADSVTFFDIYRPSRNDRDLSSSYKALEFEISKVFSQRALLSNSSLLIPAFLHHSTPGTELVCKTYKGNAEQEPHEFSTNLQCPQQY